MIVKREGEGEKHERRASLTPNPLRLTENA